MYKSTIDKTKNNTKTINRLWKGVSQERAQPVLSTQNTFKIQLNFLALRVFLRIIHTYYRYIQFYNQSKFIQKRMTDIYECCFLYVKTKIKRHTINECSSLTNTSLVKLTKTIELPIIIYSIWTSIKHINIDNQIENKDNHLWAATSALQYTFPCAIIMLSQIKYKNWDLHNCIQRVPYPLCENRIHCPLSIYNGNNYQ